MPSDRSELLPMFRFRVLLDWHLEYNCFVVQCLETGHTISADDIEMAQSMIVELLEDEIEFAIQHGNVRNLTSSPCSIVLWKQWTDAVRDGSEIIRKHFSHERTSLGKIDTQIALVIRISHAPVKEALHD